MIVSTPRVPAFRAACGVLLSLFLACCQRGTASLPPGVRIIPQSPGTPASAASLPPADVRPDTDATRPRITLDPADTVLQVVNLSVDKDAEEEQVIAVKRADDVEAPVRLIVADADPARGAYYYQSWESPTNATDSRVFTLSVKDIIGDHSLQIIASGVNSAGKLTLDVFRRAQSDQVKDPEYRPICQLVADDISIEEAERPDSYSTDRGPGTSFPIVAYLRDPDSQNVTDLVRIRYTWDETQGRYVPAAPEKIPGEKVQQTQLQALYSTEGEDAFEQFIAGAWIQAPPDPAPRGPAPQPMIINFDPRQRKIAIASGNTQEVYLWRESHRTIYNRLLVMGENETVLEIHLRRRFDIVVDSMTTLTITMSGGDSEEQRVVKYVRATDDMRAKLLGSSDSVLAMSPLAVTGTYTGADGLRVDFRQPRLTWTSSAGARSGTFALFTLGSATILSARFPSTPQDDIESWLVDFHESKGARQVVRTLGLTPVQLTMSGYTDTNEDPLTLQQTVDLEKK